MLEEQQRQQHQTTIHPRNDSDVLWLHYEDLLQDRRAAVRLIANFMPGVHGDDEALLDIATQQASFEFMKQVGGWGWVLGFGVESGCLARVCQSVGMDQCMWCLLHVVRSQRRPHRKAAICTSTPHSTWLRHLYNKKTYSTPQSTTSTT